MMNDELLTSTCIFLSLKLFEDRREALALERAGPPIRLHLALLALR